MLSGLTPTTFVTVLVSIIISMTIHEAMHGYVAHWLGDTTAKDAGRLTLNPLKHIDVYFTVLIPMVLLLSGLPPIFAAKPVPFNPSRVRYGDYGAAMIAVAGPLTNLGLAVLGSLLFRIAIHSSNGVLPITLTWFILVNIGFFVFNMIPFPPLDGSRLLYAFAPESLRDIMRTIEGFGFLPILLFFVVAFRFIGTFISSIELSLFHILTGVAL